MSQKKSLSDFNLKMDEVAKILEGSGLDGRHARQKFVGVLTNLRFTDEDTAIFKSTDKGQGQYIFSGKEASNGIKQIFEQLFEMEYCLTTREECNSIIDMLKAIRPICKNVNQYLFLQSESEKIKEKEKKTDGLKKAILDENFEAEKRISQIVDDFYNKTRSVEIFETKLYVGEPDFLTNQTGKYEFFRYQRKYIEAWKEKWVSIMESIRTVRMTERFDIGYEWLLAHNREPERKSAQEAQELLKGFCKCGKGEEDLKKTYDNKKMMSRDVCRFVMSKCEPGKENAEKEAESIGDDKECRTSKSCLAHCKVIVEEVFKTQLKKDFEEDFYYAIGAAFDELEQIRERVLDQQRFLLYKSVMGGAGLKPEEQDLKELREARAGAKPCFGPMIP